MVDGVLPTVHTLFTTPSLADSVGEKVMFGGVHAENECQLMDLHVHL